MKEKIAMNTNEHYVQTVLPLGCWTPACRRKRGTWKRMLRKYQTQIDTIFSCIAIGLMFLTGIWMFLVQFADYLR